MKTIALIGCMLIAMTTQAQDAISRFYEKYENDHTFTNVTITSRMFSLFTDLERSYHTENDRHRFRTQSLICKI